MTLEQENEAFEKIWDDLMDEHQIKPELPPKGFVLGGQPGAGKSNLIKMINAQLNGNVLVVNGDEFRRYHPNFDEIQAQYGKESAKHTAEFSGKMTGRVIDQALKEGYNIVVEGTFRTPETPIKTLNDMQQHGYQTAVYLQTAPSEVSWQGTLERYDEMVKAGEAPRATPKEHHDLVVEKLPENADRVFLSGKADYFAVYSREGLIFDSRIHQNQLPGMAIDHELHRNTRYLEKLESRVKQEFDSLSAFQKQVIKHAEKLIAGLQPANQIHAKINLYDSQLQQLDKNPQQNMDLDIDR